MVSGGNLYDSSVGLLGSQLADCGLAGSIWAMWFGSDFNKAGATTKQKDAVLRNLWVSLGLGVGI